VTLEYIQIGPRIKEGEVDLEAMCWINIVGWILSDDFPKCFTAFMRNSRNPFHEEMYKLAKSHDPELAWNLECAIIK